MNGGQREEEEDHIEGPIRTHYDDDFEAISATVSSSVNCSHKNLNELSKNDFLANC